MGTHIVRSPRGFRHTLSPADLAFKCDMLYFFARSTGSIRTSDRPQSQECGYPVGGLFTDKQFTGEFFAWAFVSPWIGRNRSYPNRSGCFCVTALVGGVTYDSVALLSFIAGA